MSVATILNFDTDDAKWRDLAACAGIGDSPEGLALFFESYESDQESARAIDEMCSNCPVIASCLRFGVETKSEGVFGGWFLINGKPDPKRNAHKSEKVIKQLKESVLNNEVR